MCTGETEEKTLKKTLIGVLATYDSFEQHQSLKDIFENEKYQDKFKERGYHFLITGGTYERLLNGHEFAKVGIDGEKSYEKLEKFKTKEGINWLEDNSTRLPLASEGGVIILSYLITQHKCSIVWPFFSHDSQHWQRIENLAFMRLCDQCHVKRLLNECSVRTWIEYEEDKYDSELKLKTNKDEIYFPYLTIKDYNTIKANTDLINVINDLNKKRTTKENNNPLILPLSHNNLNDFRDLFQLGIDKEKKFEDMTIALIAHDGMKPKMIDFAVDYEMELKKFKRILATGTTGGEVAAATSKELEGKIFKCHSGPKGGDIEIATAILYGLCDVVIFFIDPLNAHPHIDDIRVVLQACMMNQNVIVITNEMHAREFMARVVRNNDRIRCLKN